jgi:hypothetical protein
MHAEARVDSYTVPLDAELAKVYLESYEIPVRLEGEALVGSAYALGPMLGGIGLLVEEQDEARARELLDGYHHALRQRRGAALSDGITDDSLDDGTEELGEDTPDEMASRAWSATLLACVLLPVVMHVYAIALLLRVPAKELSSKAKRRYVTAWVLNLAVIAVASWFVARSLG